MRKSVERTLRQQKLTMDESRVLVKFYENELEGYPYKVRCLLRERRYMDAFQRERGRQSNRYVVEVLEGRRLFSVSLVADINQIPTSTTALGQLTDNNSTLFFADNDGYSGTELWKSDSTTAGTMLGKDINPGSASSNPTGLTSINGELYFAATDTTGVAGLWKSDGSASGTTKISSGSSYLASPRSEVYFNGSIFFLASDNNTTTGGSLWKTDGSTAQEVKNVYDSNGISPNSLTVFNGALYFFNGGSRWRTDHIGWYGGWNHCY